MFVLSGDLVGLAGETAAAAAARVNYNKQERDWRDALWGMHLGMQAARHSLFIPRSKNKGEHFDPCCGSSANVNGQSEFNMIFRKEL